MMDLGTWYRDMIDTGELFARGLLRVSYENLKSRIKYHLLLVMFLLGL